MNDLLEQLKKYTEKMEQEETIDVELYNLLMGCIIEFTVLKNKQQIDSWNNNPDRMGGQFTEEESNRSNQWI